MNIIKKSSLIFLFAGLLVILYAQDASSSPSSNLLQNPGFEDGSPTAFSHWTFSPSNSSCSRAIYTGNAHSGSRFLATARSTDYPDCLSVWQEKYITPQVGQTYTAGFWLRNGAAQSQNVVIALWAIGPNGEAKSKTVTLTGSEWSCHQLWFSPTKTGNNRLKVEIYLDQTWNMDIHADDLYLGYGQVNYCPPSDATPPTASITAPSNGSVITSPSVQLAANAQDTGGSGLNRVEFYASYNNQTNRIATDSSPPFNANWTIPDTVPPGTIIFSVVAFDNAGNRSQNSNRTYSAVTYEKSTASCSVPYFSQWDARWRDHPLRSNGACSAICGRIGYCGCTLTSTAMLFKQYGANTNPAVLSDCMGNKACPFHWNVSNNCSSNKATFAASRPFSWQLLDQEINQHRKPVILGMAGYVGGRNRTHWVLVIAGSGSNSANYTIHDPGPLNGRNASLSTLTSRGYNLQTIVTYHGGTLCPASVAPSNVTSVPELAQVVTENPFFLPDTEYLQEGTAEVSGWVYPYRLTDTEMIVQIQIESSTDQVVEMKVWTDSMPNSSWQEYYPLVTLPISDEIYVQLRTESGDTSETWSSTSYPSNFPDGPVLSVYLPLITR